MNDILRIDQHSRTHRSDTVFQLYNRYIHYTGI